MNLNKVKEILGKPYYQNEDCIIYNINCVDAMQALPKNFIHLTVTSPPYNIGKEYEKPMPLGSFVEWCEVWINQIHRITSDNGALWLNLGYTQILNHAKAVPLPYLLWNKSPFYLIQEIIWNYGAGVAGRNFFSPRNEKFLWYVKDEAQYIFNLDDIRDPNVKYPNQKKNGKIKVNPLGKNPTDVWQFPKVTSGKNRASKERTQHPAQFPVAVIERIIKASSNEGNIVLDPFMGSGTTAVVASNLKRPVVGFEIREDYCEIAAMRVEKFAEPKPVEEPQYNMFKKENQLSIEQLSHKTAC
jgi:adenine-specific DNA-methyltransferase